MHRAVRFIRYHAKDYHIDPDRLGITGASAGGHLSLMHGHGRNTGRPKRRRSDRSRLQPGPGRRLFLPADGFPQLEQARRTSSTFSILDSRFKAAVDFKELDQKRSAFSCRSPTRRSAGHPPPISPATHVRADDPPTLIIHGDKDKLVPMQQSEMIVARFKEVGVPAKLIVKKGCGHGWFTILKDAETCADWFDQYLKDGKKASQ